MQNLKMPLSIHGQNLPLPDDWFQGDQQTRALQSPNCILFMDSLNSPCQQVCSALASDNNRTFCYGNLSVLFSQWSVMQFGCKRLNGQARFAGGKSVPWINRAWCGRCSLWCISCYITPDLETEYVSVVTLHRHLANLALGLLLH